MTKVAFALAVLAALASPAAGQKRRAARHPGQPCSTAFSLAPSWTGSVSAAGVQRAVVIVHAQSPQCSSWAAYSTASWVTVEAAPMDAQPAAYVTVAANPNPEPRSAAVVIAGVRLSLTQDAASAVAPRDTNLIVNGSFHTNLAPWGWQSRFPNGNGSAQWSQFDANGSPASGSMLLRDSDFNLAFQQLQCVPVTNRTNYRFGAKVRAFEGSDRGEGVMAVFLYPAPDCSGSFTGQFVSLLRPADIGVWEEFSFPMTTGSRTEAVIVVISSAATIPPFEMWYDDVFLRQQ